MPEQRLERTRAAYVTRPHTAGTFRPGDVFTSHGHYSDPRPPTRDELHAAYLQGDLGSLDGFDWRWAPPTPTRWARVKAWVWRLTHRAPKTSDGHWCGTLDRPADPLTAISANARRRGVDAHLGAVEE